MSDEMEKEYLGIKELAAAVADATDSGTKYRGRGNASEVPNERTLKYYLSENLLPVPERKRGVSLVFERKHLLIVLAIKKLQQLGLATNVIKEALDGKSEEELEQIINEGITVKLVDDPAEARRFRGMSSGELAEEFGETVQKVEIGPDRTAAVDYFERSLQAERGEDVLMSMPPPAPMQAAGSPAFIRSAAITPQSSTKLSEPEPTSLSWRRHELAAGLELHIRDDFEPPAGFLAWRRLIQKIKAILTSVNFV